MTRRILLVLGIVALGACQSLPPRYDQLTGLRRTPEYLVTLDLEPPRFAVTTEDGILCLAEDALRTGDVPFTYHLARGLFTDRAKVDRINENLGILKPQSSQIPQARLGLFPARGDDDLVISILDEEGEASTVEVKLWNEGRSGDLLELEMEAAEAEDFVARFTGAGVFAWRDRHYQLVGVLNGIYLVDRPVVAFIGLGEIARILPSGSSFFERRLRVHRPDFEYGLHGPPEARDDSKTSNDSDIQGN